VALIQSHARGAHWRWAADRVEQIKASIRAKVEHPFAESGNSCSR
jgi:hypothetical protein